MWYGIAWVSGFTSAILLEAFLKLNETNAIKHHEATGPSYKPRKGSNMREPLK